MHRVSRLSRKSVLIHDDSDRPFTVYCDRLGRLGQRFIAGRVGIEPSPHAREYGRRYRAATASAAEAKARKFNAADIAAARENRASN